MIKLIPRELFPTHTLSLRTPRGSNIRFGTRNLYVDLPWIVYHFMYLGMSKATEIDLTTEIVRKEWKEFLQNNRTLLTISEKPFVSIYLRSDTFSGKKSFVLNVKWHLFVKYLEERARVLMLDVKRDGETVLQVYKEIWVNYFNILTEIGPAEPLIFPTTREKFRTLLKRTKDYYYIRELLEQFENITTLIDETQKNEIPSLRIYTNNLRMNIQYLRTLIDVLDIPATYLVLRNMLESLIKLFIYLKIGKSFELNLFLSTLFLYEYQTSDKNVKKRSRGSLKNFKKEFIRKLQKILPAFSSVETVDLTKVVDKFQEKHLPLLRVNKKVLEDFSKYYGLEGTNLKELYSACSNVIHNQSPLPFFSLLEVKFFKKFLELYMQSLQRIIEKLINKNIQPAEIHFASITRDEGILKECLQAVKVLKAKYNDELKDYIKRAITAQRKVQDEFFLEPLILTSLFYLISPSPKQLRNLSFIEEDMKEIIEKLQSFSFRGITQYEIDMTLNNFKETLLPELEKFSVFSSLKSIEKKRMTIFYLLLHYLPKMIEEL